MIGLVGISFKTAELKIREQFSFSDEEIIEFSEFLKNDYEHKELVVLSTCNRTEIYFYSLKVNDNEAFNTILNALFKFKNYTKHLKQYFYFKSSIQVAEHLFKVTSGIDSLVIGEDQIIGQVKSAFNYAQEIKSAETILTRLFTKSFEAGKKVRSETKINQGSGSVSSAAVDLCHKNYRDLQNRSILLIGAGETGQLVLTSLSKHKIKSLYIANRTFSNAQELAERFNGKALNLDEIETYLEKSDIIIIATNSKKHIISKEIAEKVNSRKKLYIDLSVPRNIDEKVSEIENAELFAVDDLNKIVNSTTQKRIDAISDAMVIINSVTADYMDWLIMRGLSPIFSKIKKNFQEINEKELEGFLKANSIENKKEIIDYGKHITDKYARLFIKNLREIVKNGEKKEYIESINKLFELQ
ncbi:MAG: glutamyl-tRNA reductase [Bacteroidales bacterium]|nr:glutamyl-tRNA reductase [Bacteroidales bacterium]